MSARGKVRMNDALPRDLGLTPSPLDSLDAFAPVGDLLEQTAAAFEGRGMPLARRWAETLMAAVLDVPHKELHAHAGRMLDPQQRRHFEEIARAASREVPLAYVIGRAPFLDWDFEVSHDTLISKEALAVARRNVARHGVEHLVALEQGDLWEPVAALAKGCPFDLILSNPPYIPTQNTADMGRHVAEHEPHLALDGGADGLDPHRRI